MVTIVTITVLLCAQWYHIGWRTQKPALNIRIVWQGCSCMLQCSLGQNLIISLCRIWFVYFFILEYISPLILVQLYCMTVGWSQNSFLFWKTRNCSWFQALGITRTKIIPLPRYQDCSCLLWNSLEKLAVRIDSFAVLCLPSLLPWSLRLLLFSLSPSQLLRGTCVTPCARTWAAGAQGPSTASPAGFSVVRRSVWNSATSCKGKGPGGCLGFWQWFGGGGY